MTKILVIEDEPTVRANILELLEIENYEVVSAENGLLGALWAQEHIPDLIICDVMMPEVNGYEVLNSLRQEPMTATIPFIFLTAMADKADMRHGMELGADDYLTKPFTRAELMGAIASRLAKHNNLMQPYSTEHKRAEALQQKVQELQQYIEAKDSFCKQFEQQIYKTVPKLNIAIHLLKNMQPGTQHSRCLEILQAACAEEISLLNQMPNLENLLPSENVELLRQLHQFTGN